MTGRDGRYLTPFYNDRRSRKERRKFSYTKHIPERRAGRERRSGLERRTGKERRLGSERRKTYIRVEAIHENDCESNALDTF